MRNTWVVFALMGLLFGAAGGAQVDDAQTIRVLIAGVFAGGFGTMAGDELWWTWRERRRRTVERREA